MKLFTKLLLLLVVVSLLIAIPLVAGKPDTKVVLIHKPVYDDVYRVENLPNSPYWNPATGEKITISINALPAHLAHGDFQWLEAPPPPTP